MSNHTVPTDSLNFVIKGDLDVVNALSTDMGTGTIYVRDGGLYVQGLTDLDQTTINTSSGEFNVSGTNRTVFDITNSIEFSATTASFFKTSAAPLSIEANSADAANGRVIIKGDGAGAQAVHINSSAGQTVIDSAGNSTTLNSVLIKATDTVNGDVLITGAGDITSGKPAVSISATNAVSGQISIASAGDSAVVDSVSIVASGTTGGNVSIKGDGTGTAVKLHSSSASGNTIILSDGTASDTVSVLAPAGGINLNSLKEITINSADITNGVKIGTGTAGVPVTIGTGSSLTTISGDLIVSGTTTSLNTETLVVADNIIVLNSGNGELGIDAGIVARRFQTANGTSAGDVVNPTGVIQEAGIFPAGGTFTAPGTLQLAAHASSTDEFYAGWWIQIEDGTAIDTVRRIKSYNGTTKIATVFVAADNTPEPNLFEDGADITTVPTAGDNYKLHSDPYISTFYSESSDYWTFASVAETPDAIGSTGISTANIQQYQNIKTGEVNVRGKTYRNCKLVDNAGGTDISIFVRNHGLIIGDKVRITDSANITAAIPDGVYSVVSSASNSFGILLSTSVSITPETSSVTVYFFTSSVIKVNAILPADPDYSGINIPGLSVTEDVLLGKQSIAPAFIGASETSGSYFILVSDSENTDGASATFVASSSGTGGSISRISSSKGTDGQRISATWDSGEKIKINHKPAANTGTGNFTYRVRIVSAL